MDSNEILAAIREVTKVRKDNTDYDMIKATNGPLARLIVHIDDLDRHLSKGGVLPVDWEPAYHATTGEMARRDER